MSMIKTLQNSILCLLLTAVIAACSGDSNYPGPAPEVVNAAYFSGGSASGYNLRLSYSGTEWAGKEARFYTDDGITATITLKNIIPGEEYTTLEVNLEPSADSYLFSGVATTNSGCTVNYDGTVYSSYLILSLATVQPNHLLMGDWNLAPIDMDQATGAIHSMPVRVTWEASGEAAVPAAQMAMFLSSLGSSYLQNFLQGIKFHADGNIVATYRSAQSDNGWQTSPINICLYYVKNGKLYVEPDIRMITALVQQNKADTKLDLGDVDVMQLISLLTQVLQWGQEGIPVTIRENDNGTISLFLEKAAIVPIISVLPLLMDYLPLNETTAAMATGLIEQINALLPLTTRLEVGIDLSK